MLLFRKALDNCQVHERGRGQLFPEIFSMDLLFF
jgi:hypothetical protein